MERHHVTLSDNKDLFYRIWKPENGNVLMAVHLLHGMAEHSERYDRFAAYLTTLGCVVYAQDHRGHGMSAKDEDLGWFARSNGWSRVVQDTVEISEMIVRKYPDIPLFLFGHSMGSFIARSVILEKDSMYRGVIICGTGASKGFVGKVGRLIALVRSMLNGGKKPDTLLDTLSFGSFAHQFPDRKTEFDWLSKDEQQVAAYINDPLCGFICTSRFFVDLLDGVALANNSSKAKKIRKDLAILIISGENDPVGDFGTGVKKVEKLYEGAGLSRITTHLVKGGRHEILNETNYEDVYSFIGTWLVALR